MTVTTYTMASEIAKYPSHEIFSEIVHPRIEGSCALLEVGFGDGFFVLGGEVFVEGFRGMLNLVCGEDFGIKFPDVAEKTTGDDEAWELSFEGAIADKHDDAVAERFFYFKKLTKGVDVQLVLVDWVLEFALILINLLRPLVLFFRSKNPAPVVFCFDNENPIGGDDEVVDLSGSFVIGTREVKIVKDGVACWIEFFQPKADHLLFAPPTFESWAGNYGFSYEN